MSELDLEEFMRSRSPALLRLAYLLTADAHAAEDLVQDVLLKVGMKWDRIAGVSYLDAYVRKSLINQYASWRRAARFRRESIGTVPEEQSGDPTDAVLDREIVWRALGRLPSRQKAVLVLRYYEDLTDVEIAHHLNVRRGTVRSLASRALRALGVDLEIRSSSHITGSRRGTH
jgi:RNA polymerase sigma-70 factor (sigma-E family)